MAGGRGGVRPTGGDPSKTLYESLEFVGDISGAPLNEDMAIKARKAELEYFKTMRVCSQVKWGKWTRPISTKWIDTSKGDVDISNYHISRSIRKL